MFVQAQKNGLQLGDPEPTLEKLGIAAHTKQRCKAALKFGTLLIAIGLVSYVLSTVVGSGLSFVRHGHDFSVHLHDLSHQVRRFSPPPCVPSFELKTGHPRKL